MIRLTAHWAWRNDARIAAKLQGFASTEAGSFLDMLQAAELEGDPQRRRLFYEHAIDEARHARRFLDAAKAVCPVSRTRPFERAHAVRQDLYRQKGPGEFLAFVAAAERRGQAHFQALSRHFAKGRPSLSKLFHEIEYDERFHMRYAQKLFEKSGNTSFKKRILVRESTLGAWQAWRRSGRRIGDVIARLFLTVLYFASCAPFSMVLRKKRKSQQKQFVHPQVRTVLHPGASVAFASQVSLTSNENTEDDKNNKVIAKVEMTPREESLSKTLPLGGRHA